jgi:hypothetical protein
VAATSSEVSHSAGDGDTNSLWKFFTLGGRTAVARARIHVGRGGPSLLGETVMVCGSGAAQEAGVQARTQSIVVVAGNGVLAFTALLPERPSAWVNAMKNGWLNGAGPLSHESVRQTLPL